MQIAEIDFCGIADLDELVSVEQACFSDAWKRHMMENDLNDLGRVVYLKASFRERIVGYGVLSRTETVSHLRNLAVLPDFRQQGVALQLMLGFDDIASEWGCRRMRLEVRSSNKIARKFYSKLGFAYSARARGYYANGEDAIVLVARIPLKISNFAP